MHIDIDRYRVESPVVKGRNRPFLKGPVDLEWLAQTHELGGSVLAVGIVLWHFVGMARGRTVRVGLRDCELMKVKRAAARRAIDKLKAARLIAVAQTPGRKPMITVLDVRTSSSVATGLLRGSVDERGEQAP